MACSSRFILSLLLLTLVGGSLSTVPQSPTTEFHRLSASHTALPEPITLAAGKRCRDWPGPGPGRRWSSVTRTTVTEFERGDSRGRAPRCFHKGKRTPSRHNQAALPGRSPLAPAANLRGGYRRRLPDPVPPVSSGAALPALNIISSNWFWQRGQRLGDRGAWEHLLFLPEARWACAWHPQNRSTTLR